MLKDIPIIDNDIVCSIEWTGDADSYDQALCELGHDYDKFLVVNPYTKNKSLLDFVDEVPTNDQCIVFMHKDEWIAKLFYKDWTVFNGYHQIELVKPTFVWQKNQHFDRLMTFIDDPFGSYEPETWDAHYKLVWFIDPRFNPLEDKVWAVSCTPMGCKIKGEKDMGYLTPDITVEVNEKLPDLALDMDQLYPPYYDLQYECAWMLNPKIASKSNKDIWIVKFTPNYRKPKAWKWMGIIDPNFEVEFNPKIGEFEFDIDYVIPIHDLKYEHVWMLDSKHCPNGEELWAVKVRLANGQSFEQKYVGSISPTFDLKFNPDLAELDYIIDYEVPYYDFKYEHVWFLDSKHCPNGEQKIWAVKAKCVTETQGIKEIGAVSPRLFYEYNTALPKLDFNLDYDIPYHDFEYEHIWMLDSKFAPNNENIWAVKISAVKYPTGLKEMGLISPVINDRLDVIFISYYEPNAEENWQRVLEKAPWAKRVDGVQGIFEAHRQAALLSETDMFYVVDGDAWLVDDWEFDYQPGIFDRDCAYVWHSLNPVNDLVYGYGGVKLFSKEMMLRAKAMIKLDMTTSVMPKLKVMEKISNETRFDVDEFSTWRSAFRECVKLCYSSLADPNDLETKKRLDAWLKNCQGSFSKYAQLGARQAVEYTKKNYKNYKNLLEINDRDWLEEKFKSKVVK